MEPLFLEKSGLSIGDTIRLDTGTGDFEDALARREFTIVGTADSPLYISVERGSSSLGTGAVSAFVLLPQAAFSLDYYTDAYLRAEGAEELLCYSEDYTELVNSLSDALEPLAEERSALRGSPSGKRPSRPWRTPGGSCLTGRRRCLRSSPRGGGADGCPAGAG